ncbi:hypothetical protein L2E82_21092 [Cichorium intybus]|uniref:Uncharacterized protein n=1 Tax=Cichorium intybus TaxID=13427 RepID=A0ACB9DVG1_CICIN|nr:hypothetical protein L2E82_21092 [Cichorium intybus]
MVNKEFIHVRVKEVTTWTPSFIEEDTNSSLDDIEVGSEQEDNPSKPSFSFPKNNDDLGDSYADSKESSGPRSMRISASLLADRVVGIAVKHMSPGSTTALIYTQGFTLVDSIEVFHNYNLGLELDESLHRDSYNHTSSNRKALKHVHLIPLAYLVMGSQLIK